MGNHEWGRAASLLLHSHISDWFKLVLFRYSATAHKLLWSSSHTNTQFQGISFFPPNWPLPRAILASFPCFIQIFVHYFKLTLIILNTFSLPGYPHLSFTKHEPWRHHYTTKKFKLALLSSLVYIPITPQNCWKKHVSS